MTLTNPDPWSARIDFTKVLDDIAYLLGDARQDNPQLRDPAGIREVARQLDVPYGTLRNWQDGSEPRHSDGEKIIAHWCRLTGKARTFIHVDRWVHSAAKMK